MPGSNGTENTYAADFSDRNIKLIESSVIDRRLYINSYLDLLNLMSWLKSTCIHAFIFNPIIQSHISNLSAEVWAQLFYCNIERVCLCSNSNPSNNWIRRKVSLAIEATQTRKLKWWKRLLPEDNFVWTSIWISYRIISDRSLLRYDGTQELGFGVKTKEAGGSSETSKGSILWVS